MSKNRNKCTFFFVFRKKPTSVRSIFSTLFFECSDKLNFVLTFVDHLLFFFFRPSSSVISVFGDSNSVRIFMRSLKTNYTKEFNFVRSTVSIVTEWKINKPTWRIFQTGNKALNGICNYRTCKYVGIYTFGSYLLSRTIGKKCIDKTEN